MKNPVASGAPGAGSLELLVTSPPTATTLKVLVYVKGPLEAPSSIVIAMLRTVGAADVNAARKAVKRNVLVRIVKKNYVDYFKRRRLMEIA